MLISRSVSLSLSARYYRILNNRHKKVLLLLMCVRVRVCVSRTASSRCLSVSLSSSLRGDDEETKTRVLYLIEKVFSSFSDKISKKTRRQIV